MTKTEIVLTKLENLLLRALPPNTLRADGNYTVPRTWGVYEIGSPARSLRPPRHYMGNHPIRQAELAREFGNASLVALYANREDALEHKAILRRQES